MRVVDRRAPCAPRRPGRLSAMARCHGAESESATRPASGPPQGRSAVEVAARRRRPFEAPWRRGPRSPTKHSHAAARRIGPPRPPRRRRARCLRRPVAPPAAGSVGRPPRSERRWSSTPQPPSRGPGPRHARTELAPASRGARSERVRRERWVLGCSCPPRASLASTRRPPRPSGRVSACVHGRCPQAPRPEAQPELRPELRPQLEHTPLSKVHWPPQCVRWPAAAPGAPREAASPRAVRRLPLAPWAPRAGRAAPRRGRLRRRPARAPRARPRPRRRCRSGWTGQRW